MTMRFLALAIVLSCGAGFSPRLVAQTEATGARTEVRATRGVVVLPFDNVSGAQNAPREVSALLAKAIEAKGWTVSAGDAVEPLLEKERVRYLDSFDESVRKKIV